jgi:VWFA-related protein
MTERAAASRIRWHRASALCAVLAAVSVHAQDPQRPPTFRARVELLTSDVTVVDQDGRPVVDLGPQDFTVRVDGEPRVIASAQFVNLSTPAAPTGPTPLHATNEGAGIARLVALVVDEGNIRVGGGRSALRSLARLLDALAPADRVALFTIPGPSPRLPFTADFDRLRAALGRVNGRASALEGGHFTLSPGEALAIADGDRLALQEAMARECAGAVNCENDMAADAQMIADQVRERTGATLDGLVAVFEELAAVDGPKAVIFISEGLVVDRAFGNLSDLASAAAAARVTLYALRLGSDTFDAGRTGPIGVRDLQFLSGGLETLAGLARGASFTVTGSGAGVFERVARELTGYYLIGFEPGAADRDGRAHQIRIEARRPGLIVRSRREFRTGVDTAPASIEDAVVRALKAPMPLTHLPLQLSAYAFAGETPARVRMAVSAEIGRDRVAAEEVAVGFTLVDPSGRLVDSGLQRLTLMPARAGERGPLVYSGAILAAPGDYTFKFAAADAEGRVGSVETALRAQLTGGPRLRLADLVIGERDPSSGTFQLPAVPRVSQRQAVAFLEVYGDSDLDLDAAQVTIELATTEEGPALVSAPAAFTTQRSPGRRIAATTLDVALVPPGRYLARARVVAGDLPMLAAVRPFDLDVSGPATAGAAEPGGTPGPAAAGAGAAAPKLDVAAMAEPFRRDVLLAPDTVRAFVDELVANLAPNLPATLASAVAEARAGRLAAAAATATEPRLHPVTSFLRGLSAFERGDLDPAAGFFRSTLQSAPGSYAAMVYLAACYAGGGRDDEAAGAWKTSLVGFDDTPLVYLLLADAALRIADLATALDTVKEAGALWPDDERFIRRAALVLLASRRPADAYAAFDQYFALRPDDERAWLQAIQGLYQLALAGGIVESLEQDLARARRYAAEYERLKGPQVAMVRVWIDYMERRRL